MSKLDGYIRAQRPPFVATGILGTIGVGFLVYGAWWLLRGHSSPRTEDYGPIGIGVLFAAFATYLFLDNRRAIREMHRFLARPAGEIVWVYVRAHRDTRSLVLGAFDGAQTNVILNRSAVLAPSDAEIDAVLREAAQRYPRATMGFDPTRAATFAANPSSLLRA